MSAVAAPYGIRPVELIGGRFFSNSTRQIPIASAYAPTGGLGLFDPVKYSAGTIQKDTGTTTMTPVGIFMGCRYTDPNTLQPTYKAFYPAAGIVATDIYAYIVDDPDVVFQIQADGSLTSAAAIGKNIGINSTFAVTAQTQLLASGTSNGSGNFLAVTASTNSYTDLVQGVFPGMTITGSGFTTTTVTSVVHGASGVAFVGFAGAAQNVASETFTFQGFNSVGNSMLSANSAGVATSNTLPLKIVDLVQGPTSTPGDAFTDLLCIWNATMHRYRNILGT